MNSAEGQPGNHRTIPDTFSLSFVAASRSKLDISDMARIFCAIESADADGTYLGRDKEVNFPRHLEPRRL
jgi:hypothetical protein